MGVLWDAGVERCFYRRSCGHSGMGELAGVAAPAELGGASGLGRCGGCWRVLVRIVARRGAV